MKFFKLFSILFLFTVLFSCKLQPSAPKKIPSLLALSSSARTVSISSSVQAETEYVIMSPVIIGWEENSSGFEIGDAFSQNVLNQTVNTTISQNGENIVFTGSFSDNTSNYVVTLYPNNTFDFTEQLELSSGTTTYLVITSMNGAAISSTGFSGNGITKLASWNGSDSQAMYYAVKYSAKASSSFIYNHITSVTFGGTYNYGSPSLSNSSLVTAMNILDSETFSTYNYLVMRNGEGNFYRVLFNWDNSLLTQQGIDTTLNGEDYINYILANY